MRRINYDERLRAAELVEVLMQTRPGDADALHRALVVLCRRVAELEAELEELGKESEHG